MDHPLTWLLTEAQVSIVSEKAWSVQGQGHLGRAEELSYEASVI
jgi:hypothetical protein